MADRISGRDAGRINAEAFEAYLARTPEIPFRRGRPHTELMAQECGFDRRIIYDNPRCRAALNNRLKQLGRATLDEADPTTASVSNFLEVPETDPRIDKLEADLSHALNRITVLSAENRSLKEELKRLRHIENHLLDTGRLIR